MFPVLEVLVAVLVGLFYAQTAEGVAPPSWGWVLALQLLGVAIARSAAMWTAHRHRAGPPGAAVGTHARAFLYQRLASLGLYAIQVWVFGWPRATRALGIQQWILVDEIVILLPYFLHLAAGWAASYRVERLFRFRRWSLVGYVAFQARQRLLPLLPIVVLITFHDVLDKLAGKFHAIHIARLWVRTVVPVQWAVVVLVFVSVMLFAPLLFRLMWRMRPLSDGPLRRRLEAFGQRVGFRTREILLWPTHGNVLNAAIIGVAARFRYVMLTDGLIDSLTEDEVEAVYAHEVGHAKHGHMLLFLLFGLSFVFLLHLLLPRMPVFLVSSTAGMLLFAIGMAVLWWGVIFGWISRRLEQQADVYGALATAKAHDDAEGSAFISALENLAEESGQIRHLPGFRHFSIHDRTAFLREFLTDPAVRRRYRRSIRALTVVFVGVIGLVTAAAAATLPEEWWLGRAEVARQEGDAVRAIAMACRVPGGPRREGIILASVDQLRSLDGEASALAAAETIRSLLDDRLADGPLRLALGWCLVRAAETATGDDAARRASRHAEAAGPVLLALHRRPGESVDDRELRAEAAMLLGRSCLVEADAAGRAGRVIDVRGTGTWPRRIDEARAWLEEALAAEPAPPDYDQCDLEASILAREGEIGRAMRSWRKSADLRGRTIRDESVLAIAAIELRHRAPLEVSDLLELCDVIRGIAGDGLGRPTLRFMIGDTLVRAARTALVASDIRAQAFARHLLESAAPLLRRLADPPRGDLEPPRRVRAAAWSTLAEIHMLLAAYGSPPGRNRESRRAALEELAAEALREAGKLR